MTNKKNNELKFFMELNYPITVEQYYDEDKIRFGLQIPDLPGVWADGESIEEAYSQLIDTKKLWFETCLEKGLDIPEPAS